MSKSDLTPKFLAYMYFMLITKLLFILLGLSPDSNMEKAMADMIVDCVMDIRAKRRRCHFESDPALKVGAVCMSQLGPGCSKAD